MSTIASDEVIDLSMPVSGASDAVDPIPAVSTGPTPTPPGLTQRAIRTIGRTTLALLGALIVFGILVMLRGVNPVTAYRDMVVSTFTDPAQLAGIAVRATPILLAALAVAIPARAGLINVGGEGQLIIGGVAAMGVSLAFDGRVIGPITLVVMALAGAVAGGVWAGFAGVLRLKIGIAESVTTLLLNYLALDLLYFLIYERWKDRKGSGQPATRSVLDAEKLPLIGDTRLHVGLFIALISALVIYVIFRTTSWGFTLRAVGGNAEAARRAGLPVGRTLVTSMLVGGCFAGLGGFAQLAGAEYKLRPGFLIGYGYVAFLGSWLGRHRPIHVVVSCFVLSAIAISGDSLQLDSQLPAASVNVLMALVLIGVFGFGRRSAKGAAS
jgi:general nucleoside transport system permease protein